MDTKSLQRDFRWHRTCQFMEERELDGLLVFCGGPDLEQYLTNDRPGFFHVIFTCDGNIVALSSNIPPVSSNFIAWERGEEPWLDDIRLAWTGVTLVDLLREKGLDKKRVGVVGVGASGGSPMFRDGWIPFQTWASIKEGLPDTVFQDVTTDFTVLALERSPYDIECLRVAAAADEEACQAMIEATRVGATELDVYSAGMCSFYKNKSGLHVTVAMMTSGHDNFFWEPPAWLYRAQPPRTLEAGDIVMVETGASYAGMHSQFQLAIAIGKVHPDHEKCAATARKAYEAGVAAIKPGTLFNEVCEVMEQPVREIGGWHLTPMCHMMNPGAYGSSLGLDIEKQVPEFARRYPGVRGRPGGVGGKLELKPGMTIELEPNAHLGRHRVNIGGLVVVTKTGAEELHKIPTNLQRVSD